jgi:hypothetical protein
MIKLVEFLNIDKNDYANFKIHFATGSDNKRKAYDKFLIGQFDE